MADGFSLCDVAPQKKRRLLHAVPIWILPPSSSPPPPHAVVRIHAGKARQDRTDGAKKVKTQRDATRRKATQPLSTPPPVGKGGVRAARSSIWKKERQHPSAASAVSPTVHCAVRVPVCLAVTLCVCVCESVCARRAASGHRYPAAPSNSRSAISSRPDQPSAPVPLPEWRRPTSEGERHVVVVDDTIRPSNVPDACACRFRRSPSGWYPSKKSTTMPGVPGGDGGRLAVEGGGVSPRKQGSNVDAIPDF